MTSHPIFYDFLTVAILGAALAWGAFKLAQWIDGIIPPKH